MKVSQLSSFLPYDIKFPSLDSFPRLYGNAPRYAPFQRIMRYDQRHDSFSKIERFHSTQAAEEPPVAAYKHSLDFILSVDTGNATLSGPSLSPTFKSQAFQQTPTAMHALFMREPKKSSKICIVDGCVSRAKHLRRCWRHGGSFKCSVVDCVNRAKSKGLCWSHGGGTVCSHDGCRTIAVSRGRCWAHGGGKRCLVEGCSRPAFERTDNYCSSHHNRRPAVSTL